MFNKFGVLIIQPRSIKLCPTITWVAIFVLEFSILVRRTSIKIHYNAHLFIFIIFFHMFQNNNRTNEMCYSLWHINRQKKEESH